MIFVLSAFTWLDLQRYKICPSCQEVKSISKKARFCSGCGFDFLLRCKNCENRLTMEDSFCSKCGLNVIKQTPPILPSVSQPSLATTVNTVAVCPSCNATRPT